MKSKRLLLIAGTILLATMITISFVIVSKRKTADQPPPANVEKTEEQTPPASLEKTLDQPFLKSYTESVNGIGIEMVGIKGGAFTMGSPDSEVGHNKNEGPQHQVTLSPFYIGKYEVTQAQWRVIATKLPKEKMELKPDPSYFKGYNLPVEQVSWEQAVEFCERISKETGKTYRLPTEAEWEYACRAGTTGSYAGNLDEMGWYGNNSGRRRIDADLISRTAADFYKRIRDNGCHTHAVGQKKANGFGLYDMHGNVYEWCADWFGDYSGNPSVNPTGLNSGSDRVRRGGGWGFFAAYLRSASRTSLRPYVNIDFQGFRLVRTYP